MERRGPTERVAFERLWLSLAVALRRPLPRFRLWLCLREADLDPRTAARSVLATRIERELARWWNVERIDAAEARRLARALARFDPRTPTPYERAAAIADAPPR